MKKKKSARKKPIGISKARTSRRKSSNAKLNRYSKNNFLKNCLTDRLTIEEVDASIYAPDDVDLGEIVKDEITEEGTRRLENKNGTILLIFNSGTPSPVNDSEWVRLKKKIRKGDEVWRYSTYPKGRNVYNTGEIGIALVRGGIVIDYFVQIRS